MDCEGDEETNRSVTTANDYYQGLGLTTGAANEIGDAPGDSSRKRSTDDCLSALHKYDDLERGLCKGQKA